MRNKRASQPEPSKTGKKKRSLPRPLFKLVSGERERDSGEETVAQVVSEGVRRMGGR
ncbi:hypothetical protein V6Z12_D12G250900 [Gossypium hirsutum]